MIEKVKEVNEKNLENEFQQMTNQGGKVENKEKQGDILTKKIRKKRRIKEMMCIHHFLLS